MMRLPLLWLLCPLLLAVLIHFSRGAEEGFYNLNGRIYKLKCGPNDKGLICHLGWGKLGMCDANRVCQCVKEPPQFTGFIEKNLGGYKEWITEEPRPYDVKSPSIFNVKPANSKAGYAN